MGYTYYNPLKVWLDPASIADVVSYMQKYLSENPIKDTEEINQIIADYIAAHPEIIGGVQSVNGETGDVVLTASDINTTGTTTIQAVLTSLYSQISDIAQTVTGLDTRVTANTTGITNEATARANSDTALDNRINALQGSVGSPLLAATAAAMTDTSKIYVYTGSETGYTNGNWYYYNGASWTSGGVYNAVAINTDTTLTVAGMAADAKATGDGLNDLKSAVDSIVSYYQPLNLFDGVYESGFIGTNGTISPSTSYVYSKNYIEVNEGDVITWWFYSTTNQRMSSATVRFVCAYDAEKQPVSSAGANSQTHSFTVQSGIKYIRFTYNENITKWSVMTVANAEDTPSKYENNFLPYLGFDKGIENSYSLKLSVEITADDGILGFYNKMSSAYELGNCDVYIGQGAYTFTNELIEGIRAQGRRGIPIGNGCRYYFDSAKIICEYTGSNTSDIVNFFSPLDAQNTASDFEIYNLYLISKNTCYALHDDANGGNFCRHVYKNCYIELDNTALGTENGNAISKALGGGLAAYEEVIISNCVFKATNPAHTTTYQNDASYHGANNSAFSDASIVVEGCYFENIFRCSNLSGNTEAPFPRIVYTNNSCSGRDVDLPGDWTKYVWNNELRT